MKPFFDKFDARYYIIDNDNDSALVMTNHDAPMMKLVRVKFGSDGNDPTKWKTVIEEDPKRKLEYAIPIDHVRLLVC